MRPILDVHSAADLPQCAIACREGTSVKLLKILIFVVTSVVLLLLLDKLADHYDAGAALFSPGYLLLGIPITGIFAAFWWWLFRN